jgi:hypothetical protein
VISFSVFNRSLHYWRCYLSYGATHSRRPESSRYTIARCAQNICFAITNAASSLEGHSVCAFVSDTIKHLHRVLCLA